MKNRILWTITGIASVVAITSAYQPVKTPFLRAIFLMALAEIVLFLLINWKMVIKSDSR